MSNKKFPPKCSHERGSLLLIIVKIYDRYQKLPNFQISKYQVTRFIIFLQKS